MNCRRVRAAIAAWVVVSTCGVLLAGTERRGPSRFDDRVRHRDGAAIAVEPRAIETLPSSDPLRAGWERFRAQYGGSWDVFVEDRTGLPTMVSGSGVPLLTDSDTTIEGVDRRVRAFLERHTDLLGSWSPVLELDRDASLPLRDGHWQVVFRQRVDGVRVENSRYDLHVVQGRLVLLGAEHWGPVRVSGTPSLDADAARARLEAYLGERFTDVEPAGSPQLVLIAVDPDGTNDGSKSWAGPRGTGIEHVLVWRFLLDERSRSVRWVGEIDAHDGGIVAFYEGTQYGSARGGVIPVGDDGECLTGGCEVAGIPMPFADFTEAGQAESAADSYGNLVCADPLAAVETNLSGPYVRISDSCGPISETGTCGTGIDLGPKSGENCAVAPGDSAGNTAAAKAAFYHINRVAEIARFFHPANTWLRSPLTVNTNVTSSCNANWTGSVINMFRAGSNCNNTGENSDILVHEWGHGYDHNDGGGSDKPSEAYSDIVAIFTTRDSCMGRGTYNDGSTCGGYGDTCLTCTGFRDMDWAARQANTPATPTNFANARCPLDTSSFAGPCRREPHCESYVSSEAMFDFATRDLPASGLDPDSAWQVAERLWYVTRPGSGGNAYTCTPSANSCGSTSWYQRMRVADDDDGNLANGTPHAAALFAAFARHGIACGAAGDATNKSTTTCPALATPTLSRSVSAAGVQLSWGPIAGASEYRVYRGELGCNRQQVPIASLPSGQTSFLDNSADSEVLRFYRVEAFGSNPACFSRVSNCVAAPPGSRLQVDSYRLIDDGDGIPEPGETFSLPVRLVNSGGDAATGAAAKLTNPGRSTVRILRPTASWSSVPPFATSESDAPHYQVVVLDQTACGDVLDLRIEGDADNSAPFTSTLAVPLGNSLRDYPETSIVPVPYVTSGPVQTFFNVTDDRTIADLDVTLDVFHQTPTQIVVDLTSPQGTTVRLHNQTAGSGHGIETRFDRDTLPDGPGTMADFVGESALGVWTLSVQDLDPSGVNTDGYIRPRTLHLKIDGAFDCQPQSCADPKPTQAPALQIDLVRDEPQLDLVLSWTPVAGAGYHVLQSTDPSFSTAVELLATSTSATSYTLEDGVRTTPALTFFQVRAVNSCHQEGP